MELRQTIGWLLQNSVCRFSASRRQVFTFFCCLFIAFAKPQIANYISNGGFEQNYFCVQGNDIRAAKGWSSLDSSQSYTSYLSLCNGQGDLPSCSYTYQFPRSGSAIAGAWLYCGVTCPEVWSRGYLRNRLKQELIAGKTYCVRFHANIANSSSYGIDRIGIYFGGNSLDTITYVQAPITTVTPQVSNPAGNVISDTLNWILITGTFVANGSEKYALIGNFYSVIQTTTSDLTGFTDQSRVCFDDVSCISLDLPAFAGHDTMSIGGNSVYIGRQSDVGIDEACAWFKLPVVITPTTPALDTAAGIWVCPPVTSTYVVRQEICGNVKYDTVVVWKGTEGIDSRNVDLRHLSFFPNPASDLISFACTDAKEGEVFNFTFFTATGELIQDSEITFRNRRADLDVSELAAGVYCVSIRDKYGLKENGKLVIAK